MTPPTAQALVEDYLARLRAAAAVLPPERRRELLDEIADHIADAQAAGAADQPAVHALLERLGEPAEIVAAAWDDTSTSGAPTGLGMEGLALRVMAYGGVLLPVVGWLVGVAMVWMSRRFQLREKLAATLLLPGGVWGFFPLPLRVDLPGCKVTGGGCSPLGGEPGWAIALGWVLVSLAVPVVLARRLRARELARPTRAEAALPALETAALIALAFGNLALPGVGALAGAAIASRSTRWSPREKAAALLLAACSGAAFALLLVLALTDALAGARGLTYWGPLLTAYGLPLLAARLLLRRLRSRLDGQAALPAYRG